jgi:hypothetical protein
MLNCKQRPDVLQVIPLAVAYFRQSGPDLTSSGLSAGTWPKSGLETMAHSRRRSLTGIWSLLLLFTPVLVLLTFRPPEGGAAGMRNHMIMKGAIWHRRLRSWR